LSRIRVGKASAPVDLADRSRQRLRIGGLVKIDVFFVDGRRVAAVVRVCSKRGWSAF
jgi:hypothetical protein